jgi:hypothetical protein
MSLFKSLRIFAGINHDPAYFITLKLPDKKPNTFSTKMVVISRFDSISRSKSNRHRDMNDQRKAQALLDHLPQPEPPTG